MGIGEVQYQRAGRRRQRGKGKNDGEGMRAVSGPGVAGPGMAVRPVRRRCGLADDEERVFPELRIPVASQRKFLRVVVAAADLPEKRRFRGNGRAA